MNRPPGPSDHGVQVADIEAFIRDWAERECCSFDEAIDRMSGSAKGPHSIWDMPPIDSKNVVALLVDLEEVLGRSVPCTVIRPGGYADVEDLVKDLAPKIRQGTAAAARVVGAAFRGGTTLAAAARRTSH